MRADFHLFPLFSATVAAYFHIFPNCLAGLACSLPSGSRFILRSAHLFCFPLCFGFGGGLIVIIAVVIIVCCSFGLRLRFGLRCLGKLEKHRKQNQQQRCSLCNPTTTKRTGSSSSLSSSSSAAALAFAFALALAFGASESQQTNKQTNKQTRTEAEVLQPDSSTSFIVLMGVDQKNCRRETGSSSSLSSSSAAALAFAFALALAFGASESQQTRSGQTPFAILMQVHRNKQ